MKKLILITILCLLPLMTFGETNCPKGLTECDSPCGRFIDEDDDGNCDYIQSNLKAENSVKKAEAEPSNQKLTVNTSSRAALAQNKARKKEIPTQKKQNIKSPISSQKTVKPAKKTPLKKTYKKRAYRLFPIAVSLLLLYILTIILYKKKIIKPRTHFKFWNFALLLTFLISALLGILLVIMINYGIRLKLPFNIMLWHTEAGIAMFMISLFHIHWHWRYIKNIFKLIN